MRDTQARISYFIKCNMSKRKTPNGIIVHFAFFAIAQDRWL